MRGNWTNWQFSFARRIQIVLATTALITLTNTVILAQKTCTPLAPLNGGTLHQLFHAIPWDSVCDGGCNAFIVDSTVRIVAAPGIVPHREPIYHRVTPPERAQIELRGQKVHWGNIDAQPHHDTTLVAVALLRRGSTLEPNTFLVVVIPPRSLGHWAAVKLACHNGGWTAVYQGDFEG
jgi:hypothetical protein